MNNSLMALLRYSFPFVVPDQKNADPLADCADTQNIILIGAAWQKLQL